MVSKGEPGGQSAPHSVSGIRTYDWIEDQDDLIRVCDVVISRAGHGTIMKSLAFGKPMVLIPIPDHTEQYGNARRAAFLHVALMIDQNKVDSETLESAIGSVLGDAEYRVNCAKIREQAVSMRGVALACDAISELAPHN